VRQVAGARLVSLPAHAAGQRIGLFGGSFNPVHAGHVAVMTTALARLALDRLWVLVTPGNPLKDSARLPDVATRTAALRSLIADPRIIISDIEARAGLRYSCDTIDYLTRRCPHVRFVWVMGADNLAHFHRWQDWERIAATVPLAIIDRPGASYAPLSSRAAQALRACRRRERDADQLALMAPPAWIFLHARRMPQSSTMLRERKGADHSG